MTEMNVYVHRGFHQNKLFQLSSVSSVTSYVAFPSSFVTVSTIISCIMVVALSNSLINLSVGSQDFLSTPIYCVIVAATEMYPGSSPERGSEVD